MLIFIENEACNPKLEIYAAMIADYNVIILDIKMMRDTITSQKYEGLIPRALYFGEMRKNFARNELVHAQ